MKRLLAGMILAATVALADQNHMTRQTDSTREEAAQNNATSLATLKQSNAYIAMTNQMAQYNTHYAAATNKLAASTADASTQAAITKAIAALDDCHDALNKFITCFKQYVDSMQ